jgi:hypothetical protein
LRRGLAKNFYNTIVYKFDDLALDDKFVSGVISTDATSRTRIPVGTRALTIESKGLRSSLNGVARATSFATRRLNRYKFAAEYIEQINVLYGDSFNIEIGDVVLLDNADMYISNTATGVRSGGTNYYEVVNKSLDIKTGNVKLSIVNTNYSNATRGSLISPSSTIISGASTTQFTITQTGNSVFGSNEGGKWSRYTLPAVKVVSSDYTTRNDNSIITAVSGNIITVSPALSFTPQAGDILLFDTYNNCTDMQHAVYGFMGDGTFDDGTSDYTQI